MVMNFLSYARRHGPRRHAVPVDRPFGQDPQTAASETGRRRAGSAILWAATVALGLAPGAVSADDPPAPEERGSRALIVVGLPGDAAHAKDWSEIVRRWRAWLAGPGGFPAGQVRVLAPPDVASDAAGPATREAIAAELDGLRKSGVVDRLWVLWLGHASHDGTNVWLHLPGPDLSGDEVGRLCGSLKARESVFWLTSAGSGWLVKPLSAPGRVVAAATLRDQEFNETVFPRALADALERPAAELDRDHDGRVSVLELFFAAAEATAASYGTARTVATEHAQLDDNGDGEGTEPPGLALGSLVPTARPGLPPGLADGLRAGQTVLPSNQDPKPSTDRPSTP
jgi:hypothetical protein